MYASKQGDAILVTVFAHEVEAFNSRWPGSSLPVEDITFTFEKNGDLVALDPDWIDGAEAVALSHDAQAYAGREKK